MMTRQTVDTTYANLRPSDLIIDKSGQAWPIAELGPEEPVVGVNFWLCDPVTKVKLHYMTKLRIEPVKVSRVPTQADEAARLEAEFPKGWAPAGTVNDSFLSDQPETDVSIAESMLVAGAEAVAAVEANLGGEVEAVVTAEEVDAAHAATDSEPVQLPLFADMDILQMRSHLYLLHGVYAQDMKSRQETIAMHDQAHADHAAGKLNSHHIPHVHEVKS